MERFWRFVGWLVGLVFVGISIFGRAIEGPADVASIWEADTYKDQYPSLLLAVVTISLLLFSEAADLTRERTGFWRVFSLPCILLCIVFAPIFALWYGGANQTAENPGNVSVTLVVIASVSFLAIVAKLARR